MSDDRSTSALAAAVARCLSEAPVSPASAARIEPTLSAFVRYAQASGFGQLQQVTAEVAGDFLAARLTSGLRPTLATQYNRRTALRLLFASARRLGWPTAIRH